MSRLSKKQLLIKNQRLKFIFMVLLWGTAPTEASPSTSTPPCRTEGLAFGFGFGVKLLNLKNISTKNPTAVLPQRTYDSFANTSSPVISFYARKYVPNLLFLPVFWGVEFNYLTDMRKRNIYGSLNFSSPILDTGYAYRERWDARVMLGAQVWSGSQLDLWAQAGLQATYFDYEGITTEINNATTRFKMDNNIALAPAGGLELRYSFPRLINNRIATDFILGWTAGYRNAFKVSGITPTGNVFNIAMSSNWSHTFGFKLMFRF